MKKEVIVAQIVAKIHETLIHAIPSASKAPVSSETLVSLAKELNFVVGVRGRGGGFEPTDTGLQFAGENVAEYRNQERLDQAKRDAENMARKQERQQMFTQAIEQARTGTTRFNQ